MEEVAMLHGRYELKQIIGSGAHGNVYHGVETASQKSVAIKHLRPDVVRSDPDLLHRFQREAEALRQLNHPNIVHVLDTFAEASDHYIVMDFLAGGSLRGLLEKTPCLPVEHTLRLGLDLSDALIRAHRLGIIHRDLKPANVLLTEEGTPCLTDFGVAFLPEKERLTDSQGLVGTLQYIAPEVINGEPPSPSSDIWSFGVMLYEMLAGKRPFDHATATGIIVAILTQPPGDLEALRPDVPAALIDLIYRMLDKNVATRVATVRRVGAELEAILQSVVKGLSAVSVGWADVAASTGKIDITPPIKHNLPAQTTAFVGREHEIDDLLRLLDPTVASRSRLVTLLGPGGMGKSRLSLEVGQKLITSETKPYPDGVYFVALAPLSAAERLPHAIAEAVGYLMQTDSGEPLEQLAAFLADRHTFLILDNFEHLTEGAGLVAHLLEAAPYLTVLVTSRERLNLSAEHLFTLKGLTTPAAIISTSPLEYSAVQLFVQSAQRVQPGFKLKEADMSSVAQICRMVQGLPLGVMLAATWAEMLSPTEIAAELNKSAEFLEANMKDLPERHRSMRAVFEYSWQRLSETERQTLSRLSVFSGAFSRSAAQAVTGASLRDLMQLVNKSLLYRDSETGLYTLHELVRQFAESHLKTLSGDHARTLEAHSHYYCAWLNELLPIMQGPQVTAIKSIDAEIDNIRQAWQQAIVRKDIEALGKAEETLSLYCHLRFLYEEFIPSYDDATKALETLPANPIRDQVLGRLYSRQAYTYSPLRSQEIAFQNADRAVQLLRQTQDELGLCCALHMLSRQYLYTHGDSNQAETLIQESLALAQMHHFTFYEARIQLELAHFTLSQEKQDQSISWAEKALASFKQIQHPEGCADSLIVAGQWYFWFSNVEQTIEMFQAALQHYELIESWPNLVTCWNYHLIAYTHLGNYPAAHQAGQQALRLADDYGMRSHKLWIYVNMGHLARLEGRYQEALEHYQQAEKDAHLPGIHPLAPLFLRLNPVRALIEMGRMDEADVILHNLETVEEQVWQGLEDHVVDLKRIRGHWYKAKQQFDNAGTCYLKAAQLGIHLGNLHAYKDLFIDLAEVWQEQRDYQRAAKVTSLVQHIPYISLVYRNKARAVLAASRLHLSDEEWTQIENEVTATTPEQYAEALIKHLPALTDE